MQPMNEICEKCEALNVLCGGCKSDECMHLHKASIRSWACAFRKGVEKEDKNDVNE